LISDTPTAGSGLPFLFDASTCTPRAIIPALIVCTYPRFGAGSLRMYRAGVNFDGSSIKATLPPCAATISLNFARAEPSLKCFSTVCLADSVEPATPGGGLGLVNIAFDSSSGQWDYKQDFTTQSAMEAAFPNGTYTFNSGGTTANFPLTGNLYTNIPTATFNLSGIWSTSIYYIQPGQDLTINTNSIAGFTTGNYRVGIDANVNNNINSYPSIQFDSLNNGLTTANGNITIPGSELTAGTDWQVKMQFNAFSNFTSSGINGGTNVALYTMNTKFDVQVVPEPGETALMIGTLALGAAQLWRRRKA